MVYMVCRILQHYGAETFATFRHALESGQGDDLRRAFTAVRGQGSGLSFNYLRILTGDTNAVKETGWSPGLLRMGWKYAT